MASRKLLSMVAVGALALASACSGSDDNPTPDADAHPFSSFDEIRGYVEADREARLYAGAVEEGTVVWYTSLVLQPIIEEIVAAFEDKYPGVRVDFFRGSDRDLAQRVVAEYQAGRHDVDVITPSGSGPYIARELDVPAWESPVLEPYPIGEETGRSERKNWVTFAQYARAFGYNTERVQASELPKDWEDLLQPHWKGRMVWSNSPTLALMVIGGLLETRGEAEGMRLLEGLATQDIAVVSAGPAATVDQVVAGAYDACICAVHTVAGLKKQGAPIDFVMLGDTFFQSVQYTMFAPEPAHPHAAALFQDFLLSADGGQKVLSDNDYVPQHPQYAAQQQALQGQKSWVMTDELQAEKGERWQQILNDLFVG